MKTIVVLLTIMLFSNSILIARTDSTVKSIKTKEYDSTTNLVVWPVELHPINASWYVYNEIEIAASPEEVWNILIDAKKWHTFYKGVESPIEFLDSTATTLKNGLQFRMNTMGLEIFPTMKEFIPNERMAWEVTRNGLHAYHAWVIVPTHNGCRLITPESQNGFFTLLQRIFQPNKLLNIHEHWLEVIKARAERTTPKLSALERKNIQEVLQNSHKKFKESIKGLSISQLQYTVDHKWTIAECIEHIALSELEFPAIVKKALQIPANPELRSEITISDDEIRPIMLNSTWKGHSPEKLKPTNHFSTSIETIAEYEKQRLETIAYCLSTEDDLRNRYWEHPKTGVIDLYQTMLLMSAHLERHIEQIEEVKKSPNFPIK